MAINPFFNFTKAQCLLAIAEIQERIRNGAATVSLPGGGYVQHYDPKVDQKNLEHLANRLAEIDGLPKPSRARVKAFVIDHVGYNIGCID